MPAPTRQRRIACLIAALLVLAAMPMPASAAVLDFGNDPPLATYGVDGSNQPGFIVSYQNGSLSTLEAWVNESDNRKLVRANEQWNRAVVAAPSWHVDDLGLIATAASTLTTQLATESWVLDVTPNYEVSLDRPEAVRADEFDAPRIGITRLNDPDHPTDGVAFSDDVNETTLRDARDAIGADNVSADGTNRTLAIVDTGANVANGQVFGNGTDNSTIRILNASENTMTNESVNISAGNYSAVADGNGHGSWVAAAAAANHSDAEYDGVAPDADLLIYKALDDDGSGTTAAITEAIRLAADEDADVVGLSLGSPLYNKAFQEAVEYATDNGTAVVVAAGNSRLSRGANIATPADIEGVLSVGATNSANASHAESAYFSQVGPDPGTEDDSGGVTAGAGVDVGAPGMELVAKTADESGAVANDTLSGTSMAQPLVAGGLIAALDANSTLRDLDPSGQHAEVRKAARPVANASAVEVGNGLVAVDNLKNGTHPATEQAGAMDDAAATRNAYYRTESATSGGIFAQLFHEVT